MRKTRHVLAALLFTGLAVASIPAKAADEASLWEAMRSGEAFAIIRHALAPGTGDPADFDVTDCATQRNLNDVGRAQAAALGDRFRANGIDGVTVQTSAWCRCRETAELMALGPVMALPPLDSFFRQMDRRATQTDALKAWLDDHPQGAPIILVTHQVNITALTDIFPTSGEVIVVRRGDHTVLGRL